MLAANKARALVEDFKKAGYHSVDFDDIRMANGVYFHNIQARSFKDVKNMILMK